MSFLLGSMILHVSRTIIFCSVVKGIIVSFVDSGEWFVMFGT